MKPKHIIDMHTHLWGDASGLSPDERRKAWLIEAADRLGVEALAVSPLFGGLEPTPEQIAAGNDAVARFAAEDAGALRPFVTVHPPHEDHALGELRRRIEQQHFAGLKIWVTIADQPCVYRLIERMIDYARPTLIHCLHKSVGQLPNESQPEHIAALARRYGEAKIIMAHLGGNFLYSCDVVRDCPNVWADPSGTYCETGMLEHAANVLGVERLVFGSDAPGASLINNIAKVMAADLPAAAKQRIMHANARELLA